MVGRCRQCDETEGVGSNEHRGSFILNNAMKLLGIQFH
jgi:hypothetical protein